MFSNGTIEIQGLTAWGRLEPRPHHLDLAPRVGGQAFHACLLAPDDATYLAHLAAARGRPARDTGGTYLGSMADAILLAMLEAADCVARPELIEGESRKEERRP